MMESSPQRTGVGCPAGAVGMGNKEASVMCCTREKGRTPVYLNPGGEHSQLSIIPGFFCLLQSLLRNLLTVNVLFKYVCFGDISLC